VTGEFIERREHPGVEGEIYALRRDVHDVKDAMQKIAEAVTRLAVLEEKHTAQSGAINRAFSSLKAVEESVAKHEKADDEKHASLERTMAFVKGILITVSVLWTVFGVFISDTVRETVKAVEVIKVHVNEDKVKSPEDVKKLMESSK